MEPRLDRRPISLEQSRGDPVDDVVQHGKLAP